MSLTGKIKENVFADHLKYFSLGSAKVNGKISNPTDSIVAKYDANYFTAKFGYRSYNATNLGYPMGKKLSASFTAKGQDLILKNATQKELSRLQVKTLIKNLSLEGSTDQKFTANAYG